MYLQIGKDKFITTENIIGIFDLDNTTVCKASRDYINNAEKLGETETISYDLPKSFIVSTENKKRKIYISPYATGTIFKRID